MAMYTVELNTIVKSGFNIFNFDYEFYDDTKKDDFEQKFINHFYFREIGTETVGRFQHYLKCKFDETLPYYNMLFRTALVDYEQIINFNVTETLTKDNTRNNNLTGNGSLDGTSSSNKTSELDSETNHTETNNFSKNETLTEIATDGTTVTTTIDNKKVGSDTPNALLSMEDITNNVYASKAEIDTNTSTVADNKQLNNNKTDVLTESTTVTTKDTVNGTNTENSDDSFHNSSTNEQTITETQNENYTKETKGNIGVRSEAEMLQKHIELQKVLTTILIKFFNECEDLFMQIY